MVERCVRDAEAASSNLVASMFMACWSSGQDDALSRRKPGFDSRTGHLLLQCDAAAFLLDASVAQLVEQRIRNAWVGGSSPPGSLCAVYGEKRRVVVKTARFFVMEMSQYGFCQKSSVILTEGIAFVYT